MTFKEIVLDANILIRSILGKRVRDILFKYQHFVTFYLPLISIKEGKMNFNIYLEDTLGHHLENLAQKEGKTRNTLIREAIKAFVEKKTDFYWSSAIMNFQGFDEGITFESYRDDLLPPHDKGMS